MSIELAAPCALPLALIRGTGGEPCLLGMTLQHPPVNLVARQAAKPLITGARADLANRLVAQIQSHQPVLAGLGAEVEIELAIPRLMGLCSDAMLGLSLAQALLLLAGRPTDLPTLAATLGKITLTQAFAAHCFDTGGLVLTQALATPSGGPPPLLRRATIAHPERDAWVFVVVLPRTPPNLLPTFEDDRLTALLLALPQLSSESNTLLDQSLWPAVAHDKFEDFASALTALRGHSEAALRANGVGWELNAWEKGVLDVMRREGALACGRSLSGLALYGLVQGAHPSITLRTALRAYIGEFGGTVLATITDNRGAAYRNVD